MCAMPNSTASQRTPESLTSSFHTVCSCWAWVGSYRCLSCDALRHRHAEPGHPVERRAGGPGLGLLAGQSPGAKAPTDDGLVAGHGGLPERAPAVADRLLPAHAPPVLDHLDMLVALSGRGVGAR